MKKVLLIGANGKMGRAAMSGLERHQVITASRSGQGCDHRVDIADPRSVRALFETTGRLDAVVNAVGHCEYASFDEMTDEQWRATFDSKVLGQIGLVRIGCEFLNDGGSFTLISGIFDLKPVPTAIADATASGAIDTFVRSVCFELPRGIRINAINPTVLTQSWDAYGELMPGFEPVPSVLVGKAFQRSVDGFITGQVLVVDA